MAEFAHRISAEELAHLVGTPTAPCVIDVRRREAFDASPRVVAGATWRDHHSAELWGLALPADRDIVVYCAYGHEVSQTAVALLRAAGRRGRYLAGGFAAYVTAGGTTVLKDVVPRPADGGPGRWVTRERPKVDRIGCPWLLRRFVDPQARIFYVAPDRVKEAARELDAVPFDVDGVEFSHRGELCSFDTFLDRFGLEDGALRHVARIVRGADTARLDLEPEAAGLLAMALGLSALYVDDHAALAAGMALYDGLYGWTRFAQGETHNWPAPAARA
jgi:rhodanese-related sulfurtransferase